MRSTSYEVLATWCWIVTSGWAHHFYGTVHGGRELTNSPERWVAIKLPGARDVRVAVQLGSQ